MSTICLRTRGSIVNNVRGPERTPENYLAGVTEQGFVPSVKRNLEKASSTLFVQRLVCQKVGVSMLIRIVSL
jgi:hypothetical protein